MKILYGVMANSLDDARVKVEAAISQQLHSRESLYWGGTYFVFRDATQELRLYENIDLADDEAGSPPPAEPDYPHFKHLLRIDSHSPDRQMLATLDANGIVFSLLRTSP